MTPHAPHTTNRMKRLRALAAQFARTTLLFSITVAFGTTLVMLFVSSLGYLPYSDRPGTGWWSRVHVPSLTEIGSYLGFAPWFCYFCLYFGGGLFVLSVLLGWAHCPRWLVRVIGAITAGPAAALAVAAGGWYIALAAIGPDTALVVGLAYGAFLFPKSIRYPETKRPVWMRASCISLATIAFLTWVAWPLLPKTPVHALTIEIDRITPGPNSVKWQQTAYLRPETWSAIKALHLSGELHGGAQSSISGADPDTQIVIIATQDIDRKYRLSIPKSGYVVYVVRNGIAEAHPAIAESDKRSVILEPGSDRQFSGARFALSGEEPRPFTWYPPFSH